MSRMARRLWHGHQVAFSGPDVPKVACRVPVAAVVEPGEVVRGALLGGHVVGVEAGVTLTDLEGDSCLSGRKTTLSEGKDDLSQSAHRPAKSSPASLASVKTCVGLRLGRCAGREPRRSPGGGAQARSETPGWFGPAHRLQGLRRPSWPSILPRDDGGVDLNQSPNGPTTALPSRGDAPPSCPSAWSERASNRRD